MTDEFSKLRDWAIRLHGQQKYGSYDYSYHLDQVFTLAQNYDLDKDTLLAIYLHDTIEDCGLSKRRIEIQTNENVAEIVWAVSGFGENRKEKKIDMIDKMYKYPQSINLKMLDRYVNILNSKMNNPKLYEMYIKEMDDYKHLFSLGNPAIFKDLIELIETPLKKLDTKKKLGMR